MFPIYIKDLCEDHGEELCGSHGLCSIDNIGSYKCWCDVGYIGTNCEIGKIDIFKNSFFSIKIPPFLKLVSYLHKRSTM